jgi:RND family efflux transporter MFP subunit
MVSGISTRTLILGAITLGGMVAWKAYSSQSGGEGPRPVESPSTNTQAETQSSDTVKYSDANKSEAESRTAARATVSSRAMTTSAEANKQSSDASGIEAFTEPYSDIAIAASEMGTLSSVKVKEGDVIKSGDVVAVMSDEVLKASLEVARRSMNIEGTLQSAAADVALRQSELTKLRQLRERDHASQQEVDRVVTELTIAEARHLSVREDLEIKQLEFRRIEAQLEQRCIRSPIAGIVSEVTKDAGEFVSPSDPVIARVVQLDPLLVVFSVPLNHRNAFHQDQNVTLQLGYADTTAEGTVEFVSRTTDSSNSSIRVKVRLPNPNGVYQSGERALIRLDALTTPPVPATSSDDIASPVADRNHETATR